MKFFAKIDDFGKTMAKDKSALKKYISYQKMSICEHCKVSKRTFLCLIVAEMSYV